MVRSKLWSRAYIADELRSGSFWRDLVVELVATFMLMSVQAVLPLSWGDPNLGTAVQTGLGMGFIVATMAWSLGDFSGGHMNPAVTLAMVLGCKITAVRGENNWLKKVKVFFFTVVLLICDFESLKVHLIADKINALT